MSKAERYIELVSDENGYLCDQHALRAVEIAMEEMIEWLKDNASNYIINTTPSYPDADFSAFVGGKCWADLRKAMNHE